MKETQNWNRREFIVKPLVWAGAASVAGQAELLHAVGTPSASRVVESSGAILQRTLGKTGITLPIVSMGVMNADIPGLVKRSYEVGMRMFDTAAVYQQGRNEEMVGRVIKEMGVRDNVTVATKQVMRNRPQSTAGAKQKFMNGVEASLKRLQMDHVDILYYHAVDSVEDAKAEGPLAALEQLKKDGKTRFIGISTHKTVDVIHTAIGLKMFDVALVTLNYTMAHDAGVLEVIQRAAQSGIGIVAMKTQAGGTVKPDAKLPKQLPAASQTALLKWVLNHDFVTTAIPGYSTYEHLEQDFSVAHNLAYTPEEKNFLADKAFVAEAEFCKQCGECREDCPKGVFVPGLMRSHMYAVQYGNTERAQAMLREVAGRGLEICADCESCVAACRNDVHIPRKIAQLKRLVENRALTC